jgi:adenylosuccinate synthase
MEKLLKELGPITAIIGAQWGDEGKGKLTDILTQHFDVLARASGGANAGHTVVVEGKKHVFHLLPSGCTHEDKPVFLGSGMVIHLPTLLEEIKTLEDAGIDLLPRLRISHAAHIVLDYHKEIDGALEERRQELHPDGVGTTRRGIGPAYAEKAFRTGLRMEEVALSDINDIRKIIEHNAKFAKIMFGVEVDIEKELTQIEDAKALLADCIEDTVFSLHDQIQQGKTILIEGAQAMFLDIDHGTYPYVTSSATTSAGALQGLGLPPLALSSCVGVVKAYCTRVGSGPFPAEVTGDRGDALRERGGEFGSTTGRPRRCGWLNMTDLQFAAAVNGFTHLNLTKLDVLDAEEKIPVYEGEDFIELDGWNASTAGKTKFDELPENAQKYIEYIEEESSIPVSFIGTGPGREEMIMR